MGSTPRPQGQGLLKKGLLCPRERLPRDDEGGLSQEPGVSVAVLPVDRIVIYLPSCSPRRTMIPRSARKQGCQRPGQPPRQRRRKWCPPLTARRLMGSIPRRGSSAQESCCLRNDEGDFPPESGMSVAFCPVHRRRIVVYLPTCQPEEEDPGSRDASVQVGVTCEDKATQ
ncbi:UNVERIFIED_CONTAM: hypothetical protein K2H54_012011 [Gekko kuhli]